MNSNEPYPANSTANIFLIDRSNPSSNFVDVTFRFTDSNASEETKLKIEAAKRAVGFGENKNDLSRGIGFGMKLFKRVLRGEKI